MDTGIVANLWVYCFFIAQILYCQIHEQDLWDALLVTGGAHDEEHERRDV